MTTPNSQSETAYDKLYTAIANGALNPGDRIRETDIAARFSLSRTPVRDALRRLEADGIVEHRPRVGAVVRKLEHSEVVELYEMRLVLEETAAAMAAKHASRAEVDELYALNDALREVGNIPKEAARINQNFHRCIYMAARNRFLLQSARALSNALMLLGPTTLDDEERISTVFDEHARIVDAIANSDEGDAKDAAHAHLQTSMRHRLRSLRE